MKDKLMFDLPYTAEEYEEYVQEDDEIVYIVLPETPKVYQQYCDFVIETTFNIMAIHVIGEK
jgi:hypothetical protein